MTSPLLFSQRDKATSPSSPASAGLARGRLAIEPASTRSTQGKYPLPMVRTASVTGDSSAFGAKKSSLRNGTVPNKNPEVQAKIGGDTSRLPQGDCSHSLAAFTTLFFVLGHAGAGILSSFPLGGSASKLPTVQKVGLQPSRYSEM
eukprot:scaffold8481_cov286-Pinguiococcus_pyrenoidosus.AAC.4